MKQQPFTLSSSSSQNTPPLPKMPSTLLPRDSLTLRYLSVSSDSSNHSPSTPLHDPSDFSFSFSGFSPDICYADELFSNGRLIPYKPRRPPAPSTTEMNNTHNTKRLLFPHRRSASLDGGNILRHAERPRLRRAASDSDPLTTMPPGPRWYKVFVLGPRRFSDTVEIREIKSRQRRRGSPPPTPPMHGSASLPWKLLRSLSCRGMESAVAISAGAPRPPPPQV